MQHNKNHANDNITCTYQKIKKNYKYQKSARNEILNSKILITNSDNNCWWNNDILMLDVRCIMNFNYKISYKSFATVVNSLLNKPTEQMTDKFFSIGYVR